VRALDSRLALGLLLRRRRRRGWRRTAAALGCTSIHCADDGLTRETVGQFKQPGYAVVVFTVNTPARARELFAWGADAVISSRPDLLIEAAPTDG
jgi:glycerophosphoryl diester phosphodiesterase